MGYKIKDIPVTERPRERLKEIGSNNISDKEIISIILKTGTKDKSVENLSLEILNRYTLTDLKTISLEDLTKIKGIGEVKAIEILAAIELGKRIFLKSINKSVQLTTPEEIWKDARYLFDGLKQEYFYCYYFNAKQNLIKKKLIFIGTIDHSVAHTREIFKEAYLVSAASVVCLHNHPTNDTNPSRQDVIFTERLIKTGNIQGIPVLDHIIVGENNFYSFYEHNIDLFTKNNI